MLSRSARQPGRVLAGLQRKLSAVAQNSPATTAPESSSKGKGKRPQATVDEEHIRIARDLIAARARVVAAEEQAGRVAARRAHVDASTRRTRKAHHGQTVRRSFSTYGEQSRQQSLQRVPKKPQNRPNASSSNDLWHDTADKGVASNTLTARDDWEVLSVKAGKQASRQRDDAATGLLRPGLLVETRRTGNAAIGIILCQILTAGRVRYLVLLPNGDIQPQSEDDVQYVFPDALAFSEESAKEAVGLAPSGVAASSSSAQPTILIPESEASSSIPIVQIRRAMAMRIRHLEMEVERRMRSLSQRPTFQAKTLWSHFSGAEQGLPSDEWVSVTVQEAAAFVLGDARVPDDTPTWLDLFAVYRNMMTRPEFFQASAANMRIHARFAVRPRSQYEDLVKVTRWIREHQAAEASPSKPSATRSAGSGNGSQIEEFVQISRQRIEYRRQRLSQRRKEEGCKFPPPRQEDDVHELPPLNDSCRTIRDLLIRRLLELRATQTSPYPVLAVHILKAVGLYADDALDEGALHRFLVDAGYVTEWDSFHGRRALDAEEKEHASTTPTPARHRLAKPAQSDGVDTHESVRHDFGSLPVYVIDDPSAQELDDGISVEPGPIADSHWIHVHVADPTRWLPPDHPLAMAAEKRGETLYLPTGSLPLLPSDIVTSKMSLGAGIRRREQGDRSAAGQPVLTFSALIDKSGGVSEYKVRAGIINEVRIISYAQVNKVLGYRLPQAVNVSLRNGLLSADETAGVMTRTASPSLPRDLCQLHELALTIKRRRMGGLGGLEAYVPTSSVSMPDVPSDASDDDRVWTGTPDLILHVAEGSPTAASANMLVQEFMILAGHVAGKFCAERGIAVPYRGNAAPFVPRSALGKGETADAVMQRLILSRDPENMASDPFAIMSLGLFYRPAAPSVKPVDHWSLGLRGSEGGYVRATSPLRRFGDLLCHWQIKAALLEPGASAKPAMKAQSMLRKSQLADEKARRIRNLSRSSNLYWICTFLKEASALGDRLTPDIRLDSLEARVLSGGEYSLARRGSVARVYLVQLGVEATLLQGRTEVMLQPGHGLRVKLVDAVTWPAPGLLAAIA